MPASRAMIVPPANRPEAGKTLAGGVSHRIRKTHQQSPEGDTKSVASARLVPPAGLECCANFIPWSYDHGKGYDGLRPSS